MAENRDRNKRYANPPRVKHGKVQNKSESRAQAEADKAERAEGAGQGPTDKNPGTVGKVGSDPGPDKGRDGPEFGVVAERHKTEHGAMIKRHGEAMGAMHEAHAKEAKEMHARHEKERGDIRGEDGAEKKVAATAGTPKELGTARNEGRKGSNV